jgi:hypothetical protein
MNGSRPANATALLLLAGLGILPTGAVAQVELDRLWSHDTGG